MSVEIIFRSKSFHINNEIDKKPSVYQLLYEPERIGEIFTN